MDTDALRDELARRVARDQAARNARDVAAVQAADAENLPWLKQLIAEAGWPGVSVVGERGARDVWLLVQHADRDPEFQRHCLDLMTAAVSAGEASPRWLAYLTDRVRLHEGEPQEYGTQMTSRNGRYVPRNLRDPDSVDERRAAAGLGPLAGYLERANERPGSFRAASLRCPSCAATVGFDPAEDGEPVLASCGACGWSSTVTITRPGAPPPPPPPPAAGS